MYVFIDTCTDGTFNLVVWGGGGGLQLAVFRTTL